jgi:hypothetical protein
MSGAVPSLPQYALMAWCSVKAQEQLYLLPLPENTPDSPMSRNFVYKYYEFKEMDKK